MTTFPQVLVLVLVLGTEVLVLVVGEKSLLTSLLGHSESHAPVTTPKRREENVIYYAAYFFTQR